MGKQKMCSFSESCLYGRDGCSTERLTSFISVVFIESLNISQEFMILGDGLVIKECLSGRYINHQEPG